MNKPHISNLLGGILLFLGLIATMAAAGSESLLAIAGLGVLGVWLMDAGVRMLERGGFL